MISRNVAFLTSIKLLLYTPYQIIPLKDKSQTGIGEICTIKSRNPEWKCLKGRVVERTLQIMLSFELFTQDSMQYIIMLAPLPAATEKNHCLPYYL